MKRTEGSVLIVGPWASLGLVSVALLFGHSMLMARRGAGNDVAGHQAEQAVEGAARYAVSLLEDVETPGRLPEVATYESEEVPLGEARFWFVGRPEDPASTERVFGLVDEAGKLNLNTITQARLPTLLALPGMTEELAAAIVDWVDTDDDITPNGAESETYERLQPAYSCKNGPFESIEELALLNGATREILYGEDANQNGVLDPNEDDGDKSEPQDNADGKLDFGILEYVTVFSRESNKDRVNLTDPASAPALQTKVEELLGSDLANRVLPLATAGGPLTSVLEFYIRARAQLTPEDFNKIAGALTTQTGDYVQGLININTASEAVLSTIPGIADEAPQVIAARLNRAVQDSDITWIVEAVGEQRARQVGPLITGFSYQVTADVAAVGRHARGYRRAKFVVDTSTGTPRIIYRKNLASLGWALGADVRQTLASRKEIR